VSARRLARVALAIACAATCLAAAGPAGAATVTPNIFSDEFDAVPDSTCSLREAIESTNDNADFGGCTHTGNYASDDTVLLLAGTYQLSRPTTGPGNDEGDLEVFSGDVLTIEPPAGSGATIDGGDHDRVFGNSGWLTLARVTIQNGSTAGGGGGIANHDGGQLSVRDSAIVGNETGMSGSGGGLVASGSVSTELTNVTISGNRAGYIGGGVAAFGPSVTLNNVTVTGNSAFGGGGIAAEVDGAISLRNSVVAGNTALGGEGNGNDCRKLLSEGEIESLGFNLIGTTTSCVGVFTPGAGDLTGVGGQLGPLAFNGGATQTHALLTGSPAIDAGNPAAVGSGGNSCAVTDQRGLTRPQGARCDIGAFELVPAAPPAAPAPAKCAGLKKKARKRCVCKQKKGKKRKKCLKKLKKGRKK
jgi:CSLREA domain-containing protein